MHELVYTSAPKGLKPGSQGFCTVACSAGLPPNLLARLESLSAYRPLVPPGQHAADGPSAGVHPVVRSYLILRVGWADWHVLSRIADAGVDYTQRSNKIAHHIAFEPSELPPAGPAALLACESRFFRRWDGEPKLIRKPAPFPKIESRPQICKYWESVTGDAGWGGVLAETARDSHFRNRQVILVVTPETDAIALFAEAMALLPPEIRWQTTLTTCRPAPVIGTGQTTYSMRFPSESGCRWRCVMAGSPEMLFGRAGTPAGKTTDGSQIGPMIIDLTQPLRIPVPGTLVKAARSGVATVFINAGSIAELSAALDAEHQQGKAIPDRHDDDPSVEPGVTVPIAKTPKKLKKRKRSKQDRWYETETSAADNKVAADLLVVEKKREKRGWLVLLGLGLLFFGIPIWLIVVMVFAKGCRTTAQQK